MSYTKNLSELEENSEEFESKLAYCEMSVYECNVCGCRFEVEEDA